MESVSVLACFQYRHTWNPCQALNQYTLSNQSTGHSRSLIPVVTQGTDFCQTNIYKHLNGADLVYAPGIRCLNSVIAASWFIHWYMYYE